MQLGTPVCPQLAACKHAAEGGRKESAIYLVFKFSKAIVEASDYLSSEHDWVLGC